MNISEFGDIIDAHCEECFDEALIQTWTSGPPEWLNRDDDGDFTITHCEDYKSWIKNIGLQRCLAVYCQCDFSKEVILTLCSKHLSMIVEKINNM